MNKAAIIGLGLLGGVGAYLLYRALRSQPTAQAAISYAPASIQTPMTLPALPTFNTYQTYQSLVPAYTPRNTYVAAPAAPAPTYTASPNYVESSSAQLPTTQVPKVLAEEGVIGVSKPYYAAPWATQTPEVAAAVKIDADRRYKAEYDSVMAQTGDESKATEAANAEVARFMQSKPSG